MYTHTQVLPRERVLAVTSMESLFPATLVRATEIVYSVKGFSPVMLYPTGLGITMG